MASHRIALRTGASLVVAVLVAAATAGYAVGGSHGYAGRSVVSAQGAPSRGSAQVGLRYRESMARGVVNVQKLAKKKPTQHPTVKAPRLAWKPTKAGKSPNGQPKVRVAAPATPVVATDNGPAAIAGASFAGLSDNVANIEPPDPWVAVGPDHIIQAVNLTFRTTDRHGGNPADVAMFDFFQLVPGTYNTDPHIIFDSLHGRWLATEASWDCFPGGPNGQSVYGTGYIDYAISATTDPTGAWSGGFIYYNDALPDYPAPGTSTDKVGIADNLFSMVHGSSTLGGADCVDGSSPPMGTDTVFMDWSELIAGGSFLIADLFLDPASDFIPNSMTPRVAVQAPATSSTIQEVVGYDDLSGGVGLAYLTVVGSVAAGKASINAAWDLTGSIPAVINRPSTLGTLASNQVPPEPVEPGGSIAEAVDPRVTDAVWQGNRLVFVSTYPCGAGPRDCVRVTELNTNGVSPTAPPSVAQDFLAAESGKDLFMGGVGLSGDGTLHLAWTRSSGSDNPSSYASHHLLGDAANSISTPELLASGTGSYTGDRWGDYVGIAPDPQVPSQVWNANEYSGGGSWLTKVTALQTAATTYYPIAPLRVLDTRVNNGLPGPFTANVARSWQVGGIGGLSGIPADAAAVTGNLTVTGQGAAGFVSVTVNPTTTPASSTINFPAAQTRANNVTIPLSAAGKLSAVYKAAKGKKTQLVFDVTGYFLADDGGATFTSVGPVRALDTRDGTGLAGDFLANSNRTLAVAGVVPGVPGSATAITGNLTIVNPSLTGFASVTKDPTDTPATSTINFPAHSNRANGIFAPLDGSGALSIVYKATAGAHTDVVLDITGYFEPGTGGLRFVPMTPSRIMDSRPSAVLSGITGAFSSGSPQTLDVQGHWGVPADAAAVTGNLTVAAQQAAGFVSVTPVPTASPSTSTINFPVGDTMANGIVAPLNGSGQSSFVYKAAPGKTTQLILDLSGYFQ